MAHEDDERAAHTDAEEADRHRQPHRDHRSERDDQDDDRERQSEELGRRLLELGEELTAHLDLHAVDLGELVANLVGDVAGAGEVDVFGEVDRRVRDLPGGVAAVGDLELTAGREGALHRDDVVDCRDLGEQRLHRLLHLGIGHALLGFEDDLSRLR